MPIDLPEVDESLFSNNPLEEVVCQIKFNQILKIAASSPVELQEMIRSDFPLLTKESGVQIGVSNKQQFVTAPSEPIWLFKSEDKNWVFSLSSEFIALKTSAYVDFADFFGRLKLLIDSMEQIYHPPFYTRVGLRYVNRFIQQDKQGTPIDWSKILNSNISNMYSDPAIGPGIIESQHYMVLESEDGRIGCRYSRDKGKIGDGSDAERFTLDFDHYKSGEISTNEMEPLLKTFNHSVYKLFRWCVTESAVASMRPNKTKKGTGDEG